MLGSLHVSISFNILGHNSLQSIYLWSSHHASQKGDQLLHHIQVFNILSHCHSHVEPPSRNPLLEHHHFPTRQHLARRDLSYALGGRPCTTSLLLWHPPFYLEELIPFSNCWFHSHQTHSLLWPSLLCSFIGSSKTFQKPTFIAPLGIIYLCFTAVSLSTHHP